MPSWCLTLHSHLEPTLSGTSNHACCLGTAGEGVVASSALLLCPRTPMPSILRPLSQRAPLPLVQQRSPQGLLRGLNPGPGGGKAGVAVWSVPGRHLFCIISLWRHAGYTGSAGAAFSGTVPKGLLLSRNFSSGFQKQFLESPRDEKRKARRDRGVCLPSSVAQVSSSPMVDRGNCNSSARVGWWGSV